MARESPTPAERGGGATGEPSGPRMLELGRARAGIVPAWTAREIGLGVGALLDAFAGLLPASRDARILVKPNLNNDLVALTGNSADLRVLGALLGHLRDRGYRDLTVADGPNVGIHRRGIDAFARLRVDRLAARHSARLVDLNAGDGTAVTLSAGARPRVAAAVLESDFYVSVPKVKTHAEAGLSCAMKNQVGIAVGQDKRQMHFDLARNLLALAEVVVPDLVLVDGVIGMEGNGPGDGDPFRLGRLVGADDPIVADALICRLVGLPWSEVSYLRHAREAGHLDDALLGAIEERVEVARPIRPPPVRGPMTRIAESRRLGWLKRAARPLTDRPAVAAAAHRLGAIQDVYDPRSDGVVAVARARDDCGGCARCADFCPTGLSAPEIGRRTEPADCIGCLYCWFACPEDALRLEGPLGHLERQIARYKREIERL